MSIHQQQKLNSGNSSNSQNPLPSTTTTTTTTAITSATNSNQGTTVVKHPPPPMTLSEIGPGSLRSNDDDPIFETSSCDDYHGEEEEEEDDEDADYYANFGRGASTRFGDTADFESQDFGFQPEHNWPEQQKPAPRQRKERLFDVSYACRPIGLQGRPGDQPGELGLHWLRVVKATEKAAAEHDRQSSGCCWSQKLQMQRYQLEERKQNERQAYVDRELDQQKMDRPNHRHSLQQLVVEAFRWRRAAFHVLTPPPPSEETMLATISTTATTTEDEVLLSLESSCASPLNLPLSPTASIARSLKTVPSVESVESLCGLTVDDDAIPSCTSVPVPSVAASVDPMMPVGAILHSRSLDFDTVSTSDAVSLSSTASSRLSACHRQTWKTHFPLPSEVPPRERADHTSNPLDVADRAMLYGVLDDIDAVMTTSDLGDDGLPKDRYTEVLANLQFLGLFRPKYAEGDGDDDREEDLVQFSEEQDGGDLDDHDIMRTIDVGILDDEEDKEDDGADLVIMLNDA